MRSKLVVNTIVMAAMLIVFPLAASAADIIMVSNNGVSAATLSKNDIKQIYLGKKSRWDDGQNIVFVTLKDADVHGTFLKEYIGKTPSQFRSFWKKQVFTGKGKNPKSFKSSGDLIKYVSQTKGAVAYVAKGTGTDKVKVLKVTD